MTPRQRPDACHQLRRGEGLDEIVVRTQFQPPDPVLDRIARRQQQHRHDTAARAQAPHDFESIHAGQADIEHQHIESLPRCQPCIRRRAIAQGLHGHGVRGQQARDGVGQGGVVFDEEDIHGVELSLKALSHGRL
jgi:hypothetical protein